MVTPSSPLCELAKHGLLKQLLQGKLHAKHFANTRDHLHGQERMAAQLEEVIGGAHAGAAQHALPDSGEEFLGRGGGRYVPGCEVRCVGHGKSSTVHFAVRGERHFGQRDEERGHHVVGQFGFQVGAQIHGGAGLEYDVASEAFVARGIFASDHHGVFDNGAGLETASISPSSMRCPRILT